MATVAVCCGHCRVGGIRGIGSLWHVQTLLRWLWANKMQSLLRSGITGTNVLGVRDQEPYRPFEPQYQVLQMFVAFLYMMHRFSTPASCNESGLGYVHTTYGHVKVQVGGVMCGGVQAAGSG